MSSGYKDHHVLGLAVFEFSQIQMRNIRPLFLYACAFNQNEAHCALAGDCVIMQINYVAYVEPINDRSSPFDVAVGYLPQWINRVCLCSLVHLYLLLPLLWDQDDADVMLLCAVRL